MNIPLIKNKIIAYIDAAYEWHETGEGSLDEGIGKIMGNLEEEILTAFGLPFMAFKYSDILQHEGFSNKNKSKRAENLLKILKEEAEIYLLSPITSNIEILIEAKNKFQDAVEVLPLINITVTYYNCFLYYDIFFREILNAEQLLNALRKSESLKVKESNLLNRFEPLNDSKNYTHLLKAGLPFLDKYKEFLQYKESQYKWDNYLGNFDIGDYVGFPNVIELTNFIVTHINIKDENVCCITILRIIKNTLIEMKLFCTADMMRCIMLHAKYYSLAIPPLYVSSSKFLMDDVVNINLKQAIGKNVEIENIKLEITKLNVDEEGKNSFDYLVTLIKPRNNIPDNCFGQRKNDLPF